MATIKIRPSSPDQGEYVLIEEEDFDPDIHERLGEDLTSAQIREKLDAAGIKYKSSASKVELLEALNEGKKNDPET
jgi:hypothetical protein